MTGSEAPGADQAPSILSKAFDLLRAFNPHERVMTLSELARASGLPKSTVHRLLARLIELNAIEPHRSGYKLGLGLLQLGSMTPAGYMRELAMPYLAHLHRWSGHTVHSGRAEAVRCRVLGEAGHDGDEIHHRDRGRQAARAHCTALGKALLAHENLDDLADFLPSPLSMMTARSITDVGSLIVELRKVRVEGVARERDEAQVGLSCVGAPVVMHGFAVAAVSLGFPSDASPPAGLDHALRSTAARIAKDTTAGLAQGREHWFPREY